MANGRPQAMKRHQSCDDGYTKNEFPSPKEAGSPETAHPCSEDPWSHPSTIMDALLRSENTIQNLRDTVIKQTGDVEYSTKPEEPRNANSGTSRTATVNDILKSLHSQLLLVIEWAKTIGPFVELSTDDQTALLKNFAAQHVVLCVAYRSKEAADFLRLINDSYIPRPNRHTVENNPFFLRDCEKVMDQLVAPMRFMKMDDAEFVALKACVLFNPVAKGLSSQSVLKVLETRRNIFTAMEGYVRKTKPDQTTRIGDLTFFVLSPLTSLANSIGEDILVTKLSGQARIDVLMEELILADSEEQKMPPANDMLQHSQEPAPGTSYYQENHHSQPPTSIAESVETYDFDTYATSFSNDVLTGNYDISRSASPVLGMMGAGNLMWSSPFLGSDSSPAYLPNGDGF